MLRTIIKEQLDDFNEEDTYIKKYCNRLKKGIFRIPDDFSLSAKNLTFKVLKTEIKTIGIAARKKLIITCQVLGGKYLNKKAKYQDCSALIDFYLSNNFFKKQLPFEIEVIVDRHENLKELINNFNDIFKGTENGNLTVGEASFKNNVLLIRVEYKEPKNLSNVGHFYELVQSFLKMLNYEDSFRLVHNK